MSLARSIGHHCVLDLSRKGGYCGELGTNKAFPTTKQNLLDCELSFDVQFANVYIETSLKFSLVFDAPFALQLYSELFVPLEKSGVFVKIAGERRFFL